MGYQRSLEIEQWLHAIFTLIPSISWITTSIPAGDRLSISAFEPCPT